MRPTVAQEESDSCAKATRPRAGCVEEVNLKLKLLRKDFPNSGSELANNFQSDDRNSEGRAELSRALTGAGASASERASTKEMDGAR